MKEAGVGTYTFKKGTYFHMPQTLSTLIFNKKSSWAASKNPQKFRYYIKTENYEVFIPKIAREVYNLEHRKLRKRKLRGRKLRGRKLRGYCVLWTVKRNISFVKAFLSWFHSSNLSKEATYTPSYFLEKAFSLIDKTSQEH